MKLDEQIVRLQSLFPSLGPADSALLQQVRRCGLKTLDRVGGWFAIPNIWGSHRPMIFDLSYAEACQSMFDALKRARNGKFSMCWQSKIDESHLHQSTRTLRFFTALSEIQGNPNILILRAQFGDVYRGRSARVVRRFHTGEFGLGVFAVGTMLSTHTEQLSSFRDRWIECVGDEFGAADTPINFDDVPYFFFDGEEVELDKLHVDNAFSNCGSASGYVLPDYCNVSSQVLEPLTS